MEIKGFPEKISVQANVFWRGKWKKNLVLSAETNSEIVIW